jgi:hypothetical protein
MVETAALLVDDVLPHKPIRQWVLSFPYPLRFLLASNPQVVTKVLGIVNRVLSTHLIKKAGFKKSDTYTGAVTLIQRFGSALNLNLHFHILLIDGVYQKKYNGQLRFHRVKAPTGSELNTLVATISQRIARHLERQGLLTRDDESSYLTLDLQDDDAMDQLQSHSMMCMDARMPRAQDAQERPRIESRWVLSKGAKLPLPAHAPDLRPVGQVFSANHPILGR